MTLKIIMLIVVILFFPYKNLISEGSYYTSPMVGGNFQFGYHFNNYEEYDDLINKIGIEKYSQPVGAYIGIMYKGTLGATKHWFGYDISATIGATTDNDSIRILRNPSINFSLIYYYTFDYQKTINFYPIVKIGSHLGDFKIKGEFEKDASKDFKISTNLINWLFYLGFGAEYYFDGQVPEFTTIRLDVKSPITFSKKSAWGIGFEIGYLYSPTNWEVENYLINDLPKSLLNGLMLTVSLISVSY